VLRQQNPETMQLLMEKYFEGILENFEEVSGV
jgi:hypothetical protein